MTLNIVQLITLNYTMVTDNIDSKMAVLHVYKQMQHNYTFPLLHTY